MHREMALCVMDLAEWASGANMDRICAYVLLQRITCSNRFIMLTPLARDPNTMNIMAEWQYQMACLRTQP